MRAAGQQGLRPMRTIRPAHSSRPLLSETFCAVTERSASEEPAQHVDYPRPERSSMGRVMILVGRLGLNGPVEGKHVTPQPGSSQNKMCTGSPGIV